MSQSFLNLLFRNRVSAMVEADIRDGRIRRRGEAGGMAMGVTNYPERSSSTGAVSGHERPPDQVRAEIRRQPRDDSQRSFRYIDQ